MRINNDKEKTSLIQLTGEEHWVAFSIFNANAFPTKLKDTVEACSIRAAMLLFQVSTVNKRVVADKEAFVKQMSRLFTKSWADSFINAKVNRDFDFIAIYDDPGYLSAFHASLYSLKSLLDVYAYLMIKLIIPSYSSRMTFQKANVEGQKISEGKIVHWLESTAPPTFTKASALSNVIIKHSMQWITQAVDYRDRLSHYGDIKGMEHMHVLLKREYPPSNPNEIVFPKMPDGQPVKDYCYGLVGRLRAFLEDSLRLLPNVDHKLIRFSGFVLPQP